MTLLTTAFSQGTHAARPAAASSNNGFYYYETDTTNLFQSTGSAWQQIASTGGASPLTTKGDLFGHSTVDARIPVGADNTVLTADSTQALGVKWATPSGGGGFTEKDYAQITADVTFSGGSGAQTAIITGTSVSYAGTEKLMVYAYCAALFNSGASATIVEAYRDTTSLGRIIQQAGVTGVSVLAGVRDTPAAGSHTYSIKGWVTGGTGTYSASSPFPHGYLQVVQVG